MISHALTIVANELNKHLHDTYGAADPATADPTAVLVGLGNLAEGFVPEGVARNMLIFSMVNIKEEKTLKNLPHYMKDKATLKTLYENPPVFLNFQILITATHTKYSDALLVLSRVIRFFQSKNVFTQADVDSNSMITNSPPNQLDHLESFKLIFDLYSPSMEEVNHLWGTLGGKQYPFVLYMLRMLELKFKGTPKEDGLITTIVPNLEHKDPNQPDLYYEDQDHEGPDTN